MSTYLVIVEGAVAAECIDVRDARRMARQRKGHVTDRRRMLIRTDPAPPYTARVT